MLGAIVERSADGSCQLRACRSRLKGANQKEKRWTCGRLSPRRGVTRECLVLAYVTAS
jgi:hypothetical protein